MTRWPWGAATAKRFARGLLTVDGEVLAGLRRVAGSFWRRCGARPISRAWCCWCIRRRRSAKPGARWRRRRRRKAAAPPLIILTDALRTREVTLVEGCAIRRWCSTREAGAGEGRSRAVQGRSVRSDPSAGAARRRARDGHLAPRSAEARRCCAASQPAPTEAAESGSAPRSSRRKWKRRRSKPPKVEAPRSPGRKPPKVKRRSKKAMRAFWRRAEEPVEAARPRALRWKRRAAPVETPRRSRQ